MNGIAAYATYAPRYVLTREAARAAWPALPMPGRSRAVPALDEDALTMAAHVALLAIDAAGVQGSELSAIHLATTSSPYAVKSGAAIVADYLGAPSSVWLADSGAGTHAGLAALVTALRDVELAVRGPLLVIAGDVLFAEANDAADLGYGAGAAAFVVREDGPVKLRAFDFGYSSYGGVWRATGQRVLQRYDDDRFERAAGFAPQIADAVRRLDGGLQAPADRYALGLPPGGRGPAVLEDAGVPPGRLAGFEHVAQRGDSGCANALLSLAAALDGSAEGETIAAHAYGPGTGTVSARLDVGVGACSAAHDVPEEPVELTYVEYAKHRGLIPMGGLPSFGAPYAASPAWERGKAASVGLHGGRCTACGSLNFPPRAYCLDCRGQDFEDEALARRASVLTFNLQHVVGIGPEEAPLPICTALLDGERAGRYGGKVAALLTDAALESVAVGLPVELIPRRGDVEHGLVKYGWKFRPHGGDA